MNSVNEKKPIVGSNPAAIETFIAAGDELRDKYGLNTAQCLAIAMSVFNMMVCSVKEAHGRRTQDEGYRTYVRIHRREFEPGTKNRSFAVACAYLGIHVIANSAEVAMTKGGDEA